MKTREQAVADARERASLLHCDYTVFRDSTAVPPFCYGCCSSELWGKANPSGMLVYVETVNANG